MATRKKNVKVTDMKSEFLMELARLRAKWTKRGGKQGREYASAYDRLLCAFTTPDEPGAKTKE